MKGFNYMTLERYSSAYERACSTTQERDSLVAVRPVFEAHLRHLARVETIVKQVKSYNSKEGETELWTYKIQQESSHMCNEETVEEFYKTALAQRDGTASNFLSVSLLLERRQCTLEIQKETLFATMKKITAPQSQAPLRIVALLFENTSTQHELKSLIRLWSLQNPLRFIELTDEEFLVEICSSEWQCQSTPAEKVRSYFIIFDFSNLLKQVNSAMRRLCFCVRLLMAQ
jgi:hypothetical protein